MLTYIGRRFEFITITKVCVVYVRLRVIPTRIREGPEEAKARTAERKSDSVCVCLLSNELKFGTPEKIKKPRLLMYLFVDDPQLVHNTLVITLDIHKG